MVLQEYRTKKEKGDWEEHCNSHDKVMFQRDINDKYAKTFVAATYAEIFDEIARGNNHFYEYWLPNQSFKFYIDYDRKTSLEDSSINHKNEVLSLIHAVQSLIPGIKHVHILKSVPDDTKKSYHIVFEGVHFASRPNMKKFAEEQLGPRFKDLFASKVYDTSVYTDKCFRLLHCTKWGDPRPLRLLNTQRFTADFTEEYIPESEIDLDMFKRTCVACVSPDSGHYNYRSVNTIRKKKTTVVDGDIYSDCEIVRKYLDILDSDRYADRNKWLNVGYILHSLSRDYSELWHYFSSKWEHYKNSDCTKAWDSFDSCESMYTIHNLMHLAKLDNPKDYSEITSEIPNHDIMYLKPYDNIISKLIYRMYGETFVCSNPERNEWYYFNGVRWVKENKSYNLRKRIIDDVFNRVETYRKKLASDPNVSEDIIRNYNAIARILGSGQKLACLELEFYNSNFEKLLDQNRDLLGFENGVYDLRTDEYRKGVPSDYISLSTGYEFTTVQTTAGIEELVYKILPDVETRDFTLKSIASCLDGHVRDENFYIWSGKSNSGGNGKSTLTDFILKVLGDYAYVAPVTLVTRQRESANNANSALANVRNKRAVIMQEPEANEQIQAAVMKGLTGGDRVSTRELHSSQIEFKPHAKWFMCCNKIPSVSDVDGGTMRRLKIVEFVSRFVDNPNADNPNEYLIDRNLKSKMDVLRDAFMSLLLRYYKRYKTEGLIPPETVAKVTRKYEMDNNSIKQFIDEVLSRGHSTDFIDKEELKKLYNVDSNLKMTFRSVNAFIRQLETVLGEEFRRKGNSKEMRLYYWKIRANDDVSEDTPEDCKEKTSQ
jgi:P4 family phage/plasmid primase-like protien